MKFAILVLLFAYVSAEITSDSCNEQTIRELCTHTFYEIYWSKEPKALACDAPFIAAISCLKRLDSSCPHMQDNIDDLKTSVRESCGLCSDKDVLACLGTFTSDLWAAKNASHMCQTKGNELLECLDNIKANCTEKPQLISALERSRNKIVQECKSCSNSFVKACMNPFYRSSGKAEACGKHRQTAESCLEEMEPDCSKDDLPNIKFHQKSIRKACD